MTASVVIATFNGAKYIEEQLDSIRLQSFPIAEVIISDDGSTDNTVRLISNYISKHQLEASWSLHLNEKNLGYGPNFIHAAQMSAGDVVFFADQDDIWLPDKVEIMMDLLEEHPSWQLLSVDYECFPSVETRRVVPLRVHRRMKNDGSVELMQLCTRDFYLGTLGCCMAVRKAFLDSISGYYSHNWAHDDMLWKFAVVSGKNALFHRNLVLHRVHENNVAAGVKRHERMQRAEFFGDDCRNAEHLLQFMRENNANDKDIFFVNRFIHIMELRSELLKNKKLINAFYLLRYLPYYETKKSWLVDLYVALLR